MQQNISARRSVFSIVPVHRIIYVKSSTPLNCKMLYLLNLGNPSNHFIWASYIIDRFITINRFKKQITLY